MKRGMAYVLVVIATACEFLARYLVKGTVSLGTREQEVLVKHKWVH